MIGRIISIKSILYMQTISFMLCRMHQRPADLSFETNYDFFEMFWPGYNIYIVSCKNLVTTNQFFGICLKSFDIYKGKQKLCTVRLNSKINTLINLFVKVCKLIISLILQLVYMIYQVANLPQTQIVNIQYTYKYM